MKLVTQMKMLVLAFAMSLSSAAVALDNQLTCQGNSCLVKIVPRNGSGVAGTSLSCTSAACTINGTATLGTSGNTAQQNAYGDFSVIRTDNNPVLLEILNSNAGASASATLNLIAGDGTTSSKTTNILFRNKNSTNQQYNLGTNNSDNFTLRNPTSTVLSMDPSGKAIIGASGGTQTHDLNGTLNATVGITLPSSGAMASTLAFYATAATTSSTFTFNGTGSPNSTTSIAMRVTRIGDTVTVFFPSGTTPNTTTGATVLTANTALPTWARPATLIHYFPVSQMKNNGAILTTPGMLTIDSSGIMRFYRDQGQTAFTDTAAAGPNQPCDFTYYVGTGS